MIFKNTSPFRDDYWLILILAYFVSTISRAVAITVMWNVVIFHIIENAAILSFPRGILFIILFDLAFKLKIEMNPANEIQKKEIK